MAKPERLKDIMLSMLVRRRKGFPPPAPEKTIMVLGPGNDCEPMRQLLDAREPCRAGHPDDALLRLVDRQGYERGYRDGLAKRRERDAILVIDEPGNEAIKEAWTAGWMARKALMEDETPD